MQRILPVPIFNSVQHFRSVLLTCLENIHRRILWFPFDEPLALGLVGNHQSLQKTEEFSHDPWQWDGLLWAAPKARRTNQRNMKRRRAEPKRYKRTQDLVPCETCGKPRRIGFLCSNCLQRIRDETLAIQQSMMDMWGPDDKSKIQDKETVVLYEGETLEEGDKNIVQMKKRRPGWFQKDLLS